MIFKVTGSMCICNNVPGWALLPLGKFALTSAACHASEAKQQTHSPLLCYTELCGRSEINKRKEANGCDSDC